MSIFLNATKTAWYARFLEPVVQHLGQNDTLQHVLDLGTGPGTLLELLQARKPGVQGLGLDPNPGMIAEAVRRNRHSANRFSQHPAGADLPVEANAVDAVTCCSVLFLLAEPARIQLLSEVHRVLKPGGILLVLTPTGQPHVLKTLWDGAAGLQPRHHPSFYFWKTVTAHRGRQWQAGAVLKAWARQTRSAYAAQTVFDGHAYLETLTLQS